MPVRSTGKIWSSSDRAMAATANSNVTEDTLRISRLALAATQSNLDEVSPFLLDCMYHTAARYALLNVERRAQAYSEASQDVKNAMGRLAGRWAASGITPL
jgi:hypothetical protein